MCVDHAGDVDAAMRYYALDEIDRGGDAQSTWARWPRCAWSFSERADVELGRGENGRRADPEPVAAADGRPRLLSLDNRDLQMAQTPW